MAVDARRGASVVIAASDGANAARACSAAGLPPTGQRAATRSDMRDGSLARDGGFLPLQQKSPEHGSAANGQADKA